MSDFTRAAGTRPIEAAGHTRTMLSGRPPATDRLASPDPGRPEGLVAGDPAGAAGLGALRRVFGRALPAAGPAARGLFELLAGGAIRPQAISWLTGQGVGIDELLEAGHALRAFFPMLPPAGRAVAEAALDLLEEAGTFADLQPSAALEARAGYLVSGRLAEQIFPGNESGPLREILHGLLDDGLADPRDFEALSPALRQEFQAGIRARGAVAVEAAPPGSRDSLASLLGRFGLETHGKAHAGADAGADTWARSGLTLAGLDAEAGVGAGARAAAAFSGGASAMGGLAGVDVEGGASADVSAVAKASGHVGVDPHGVGAEVYAGARVEANAQAHLSQQTSLLGGAITDTTRLAVEGHAEASAEVRAVARVGLDEDQHLEVALGVDAHARAVAEARARARKEINLFGFKIGAEAYAGAKAGAEASAHAMVTYKDGKVSVGAGAGLAAKVGLGFGGGISIGLPPFLAKGLDGAGKMFSALAGLLRGAQKAAA